MAAASLYRPDAVLTGTASRRQDRRARRVGQLLSASALALGATLGLFVLMEQLIRIDEITLEPVTTRVLPKITPEEPKIEEPRLREPVTPIDTIAPPDAQPVTPTHTQTVGIPMADIGPINMDIPSGMSDLTLIVPSYTGPVEAIPVRPPNVTYPRTAMNAGLSGSCEVLFSITPAGQPYNVNATCTDKLFVSAAEKAVSGAQFSPAKTPDGKPRAAHNLVYPLEFRFSN
ncbi:MAG: hypothetical protein CME88_12810 [Hirschia sp.]|nr:hypothetical protein [Hirschia sp.]MBF19249.1 hypothetical protein [Hirschia sp.]